MASVSCKWLDHPHDHQTLGDAKSDARGLPTGFVHKHTRRQTSHTLRRGGCGYRSPEPTFAFGGSWKNAPRLRRPTPRVQVDVRIIAQSWLGEEELRRSPHYKLAKQMVKIGTFSIPFTVLPRM